MEGFGHMESQPTTRNRRRDKCILSCTFCRGHKLRCDRKSPCGTCTRRGKAGECTYLSSEQDRKDAVDYRPRGRSQQARQRIARLESVVAEMRSMVQANGHTPAETSSSEAILSNPGPSPSPLPNNHEGDGMGNLSLAENSTVYTGSSHWATILEDITKELSEEYLNSTTDPESSASDAGMMRGSPDTRISLLNSSFRLPQEQILAQVPPRKVVDRYVSHFFNAFGMGPFLLHRKKFLAEYAVFWENPSSMPVMWVGLLFSIMSMSVFLQQQDIGPLGLPNVEAQDALKTYRTMTIHCLIAGDYLRPSRYTIETLILHFGVDQNVNIDASIGNWILIGVIIRIAMRMGLHRDPSHWSHIRPLQAEIRRRLWVVLYQMDFFTSTQVGLPRIIKDSQCDTRLPTHLQEHDLGPEHDEIPPQRPSYESTPLLHIVRRHALIKVAAEIYDATEAGTPSTDTVAALGAKLKQATDSIPADRSLESSIMDNPSAILDKMFLDILVHKSVYLLHRRSFMKGYRGDESIKSNELCLSAALAILELQQRIDEETQPGGLLYGIRWRVASSLNQEFLQATMMLCFTLSRFREGFATATNADFLHRQTGIIEALTMAKGIWEKNSSHSIEARKAAKAIAAVLQPDSYVPGVSDLAANGPFDQTVDASPESYFDNFEYGESTIFDPFFFSAENNMAAFGDTLDEFVAELNQSQQLDQSAPPS